MPIGETRGPSESPRLSSGLVSNATWSHLQQEADDILTAAPLGTLGLQILDDPARPTSLAEATPLSA